MQTEQRPRGLQGFTTVRDQIGGDDAHVAPPRLSLLVIGDGGVAAHPLPAHGEVVIGRGYDADVRIDHPSISRRHAVLRVGAGMTLEDLGSANGTRARDCALVPGAPVEVATGEALELGSAVVIVQQRVTPLRPRRLWTHGYFEARLDEECARAQALGRGFALLRIRADRSLGDDVVETRLAETLRGADVLGYYAPGEYEALLVDVSDAEARALAERVAAALGARPARCRVGVACFPRDGRDPDSLVAAASAELRDAAAEVEVDTPILPLGGAMRELYRVLDRVARSPLSVLLLGETGVGKEVLAEAVHRRSPRAGKPFLRLNCAALSETLLESELFGHERGAFTGATQAKPGLLETADGGTVFLDELGELPASMQVKLLRVIEARQVMRVGSLKPRDIDVRFVAATNRDLELEVEAGRFRQDLYFRLNGISLQVPPLRERVEEIEPLARLFAARAAREVALPFPPALEPRTCELLRAYAWPGNVRELKNVIERAIYLCGGEPIGPEHLPLEKLSGAAGRAIGRAPEPQLGGDDERDRLLRALTSCAGNQTRAARLLGISRRTMVKRLSEFQVPRPRKPAP